MRVNQLLLKKIDLRERVNLQINHKALRLIHPSLPPPKKLKQHTFQSTYRASQRFSTCCTGTTLNQRKAQHGYKSKSEIQMVNSYCAQKDKTYDNNYKRFPKRSFLRSCYVVQNSNIVINVFSKKIELEQRKNDFLVRSQVYKQKKTMKGSSPTTILHPSNKNCAIQTIRPLRGYPKNRRANSAPDVIKLREDKIQRFTPWQVQILEYQ